MRSWVASVIAAAGILIGPPPVPGTAGSPLAAMAKPADTPTDSLSPAQLTVENVTLDVTFSPGTLDLSRPQVLEWITGSAQGVAHYYGRFPVPHVRILLTPEKGAGVRFGTTL